MTTALSCRQYETRMHVAMMIDAYRTHVDNETFQPCETGNSLTRAIGLEMPNGATHVDDYHGMTVLMHPYAAIWHRCEKIHGLWDWNQRADYEIDRDWGHARTRGITINGHDIPASAFVAAQIRWERNGWLRYEYKRSKRRAAFAPFLRVAAIM